MAETIIYKRSHNRDVETEISDELNEQFKELNVKDSGRKGAKCESCVWQCPRSEWYGRARELYGRVAVFFCFLCEMFVCAECLPKHKTHEGIRVESERENERETSERLEEECDGKISLLLDDLIIESETERIEKFENSHVSIIDRVDVKHELDQTDCGISGLCGLENKRLVVCDRYNDCIKIFNLGSHVLQRYIRFVRSESEPRDVTDVGSGLSSQRYTHVRVVVCGLFGPRDVTEIDLKQNSSEPNLVSGSSSDISGTDRADPDKQCLIAVTLPWKCQLMFIDISKKPANTQKIIQTEERCWSIQFYDDKIFTVCSEGRDSPCSVYIYSTDGDKQNKFDIGIYNYYPGPYFAVVSGRVYIMDRDNDKVQCRNVEGQLIPEIKIEGSVPLGISVDPDNNVYVCAWKHNKVYKLDADLTRYESVLDQTTDYIERPDALCYYRNKLFISHYYWPPSLEKFVTVVRLL